MPEASESVRFDEALHLALEGPRYIKTLDGGEAQFPVPMGQGGTLTDQQAWDAAAFIDSQERPRDPRQTGSVADNAAANHGQDTYYGKIVEGRLLGTGTGR